MRLPTEKIKEAILSPDLELREAAVYYFAHSHSDDQSLMPLVIQAFERFGQEAFETFTFLDDLVQTDESVAWLCRQIEELNPDADDRTDNFFTGCVAALRHSDVTALKPHEETIAGLKQLDDDSKELIAERISLSSFTPEALWRELTEFCEAQDQEEETEDEDHEFGEAIAGALARYPGHFAGKVLDILKSDEEGWLELLAVQMAGAMKIEAAIPQLADLLEDPELWACDYSGRALIQIGTDSVVEEQAVRYATDDSDLRVAIARLLEDIHSDLSVQACLKLLENEQDENIRGFLIQSVLMNFASEGIEPARQHVLVMPKNPEMLEVRSDLLVAAKMLGVQFPEFEAWTDESKNDTEFRRQWYKEHPLDLPADIFEDDEMVGEGEGAFDDDFKVEPHDTIVRHVEKVGRNDPCPCGSGKKYKKCCYGEEVRETDERHSASLGGVRPGRSAPQFPIGTVALYGPDDKSTTKIVAGVIKHEGAEPLLERWVGSNIKDSPKVRRQMQAFFDRHRVKSVAAVDRNMGCPHEEGPDFPEGEDCPFCPFWAGKQGSRQEDE